MSKTWRDLLIVDSLINKGTYETPTIIEVLADSGSVENPSITIGEEEIKYNGVINENGLLKIDTDKMTVVSNVGEVLSFDGVDDYVEADRFSVINHTGTYTFEAWIFWKGDVSGILYQTIMINGAGASDRNGINITTNKQIGFQSYNGSNYNGRIYSPFPENEWVHVAAVSNAGTKKIYIDGVEVGEEGNNYQYPPSDYFRLSLHGITTNDTGPFNGVISEVRIWNVARTQQQIQDNMNGELTGNETGLVAYYKFNEGAGTIAYDSAGANHGTIHGATWVNVPRYYFTNTLANYEGGFPKLPPGNTDVSVTADIGTPTVTFKWHDRWV